VNADAEIVHSLSILSQAIQERRPCVLAVAMLDAEQDPIGKFSLVGSGLGDDEVLELLAWLCSQLGTVAEGYARSTADPAQFRLLLHALVATTPRTDATVIVHHTPLPPRQPPGETP